MPNGNGTGPAGAGPMTGRGVGKCGGNVGPGWQAVGGGGGRCGIHPRGYFRNHAQHAVTSADAMVLQSKIDTLHAQLASLEHQLTELGVKKDDETTD